MDAETRIDQAMASLQKDMAEFKANYAKLVQAVGPITENRVTVVLNDDGSVDRVEFQIMAKGFMTGAEINDAIAIGLARAQEAALSAPTPSPRTDEEKQKIIDDIRWRREHGTRGIDEPFVSWDTNVEVRVGAGRVVSIRCDEDWLRSAREKTISDAIADATKQALGRKGKT